jgi:hypothetical protein
MKRFSHRIFCFALLKWYNSYFAPYNNSTFPSMKKWTLIFLLLCLLLLSAIYIFIPGKLRIAAVSFIHTNPNIASRYLQDKNKWNRWWPHSRLSDAASVNGNYFYNHDFNYGISGYMANRVSIHIQNNYISTNSFLNIIPVSMDSAAVEWSTTLTTGASPVARINSYLQAHKLKRNMQEVLKNLKTFLEKQENTYSIRIKQTKVKDTLLIAVKTVSATYPSTPFIYHLINTLKQYAAGEGATATNYPMLHVAQTDQNMYGVEVALPVNKALPGNKTILYRRMVPGYILEAEVRGGNQTVSNAFAEMELYRNDYQRSSPAIPFESLVTDRMEEKDTAKWITRIYYPVY